MTRARRSIATFAAATALAAMPGAAGAQPVKQCVDPDPDSSGMYVCAGVDPTTGSLTAMVTTTDTKYVLEVTAEGVWLCVHTSASHECILEPN
ncbi:MAG TPA: hypothetical protein VEU29_01190 [Actinomycetota bacterium]|nr:hypothetical protein [Actinomycetota bacterium]